jgi:hypothetical protein
MGSAGFILAQSAAPLAEVRTVRATLVQVCDTGAGAVLSMRNF